jgi:hypothetical protein
VGICAQLKCIRIYEVNKRPKCLGLTLDEYLYICHHAATLRESCTLNAVASFGCEGPNQSNQIRCLLLSLNAYVDPSEIKKRLPLLVASTDQSHRGNRNDGGKKGP